MLPDRASVRMSREAGLMTSDSIQCRYRMSMIFSLFLSGAWAPSEPPRFRKASGRRHPLAARPERFERVRTDKNSLMIIGNENDQVKKGQLVDALACTGDEGRDTLR